VTAWRILNIVIWLSMMIYMAPGAWSAVTGKALRRGDPMRLACFATAFVIVGFNGRWLLAPDSEMIWQTLYALSAAVGVYIIRLAHAYGRGPRV
jgi:hypothetical protein